jgi:hypothetical protein
MTTPCPGQAAAGTERSCRPPGPVAAQPFGRGSEPVRPPRARSSTCMASRMAPSIRRSRSVGVISPRSACSRKTAQVCWSAASTVRAVITVPTSTPGILPGCPAGSEALVPARHGPPARLNDLPAGRGGRPGTRRRSGSYARPAAHEGGGTWWNPAGTGMFSMLRLAAVGDSHWKPVWSPPVSSRTGR